MRIDRDPWDAWRLLTSPMTEAEARAAAKAFEAMHPQVEVILADPRRDLALTWDRKGVEMFRDLLLNRSAASDVALAEMQRVAHLLDEWLERADPYEDPDDVWPGLSG